MKIDGKQLANEILENLKSAIRNSQLSNSQNIPPTMAIILVGENPTSLSYIKQKQKSAEIIGVKVVLKQFPITISQIDLINQISQINSDPSIHGLIIQKPLPSQINNDIITQTITPEKDIDGFHPQSKFVSPVSLAVLKVLEDIYCRGRVFLPQKKGEKTSPLHPKFINWLNSQEIVLLGRGETGGKPIANTLDKLKIKYTQTHSKTLNTKELLKQADIIISAVGKPNLITGDMIKQGSICIGVGISRSNVIASEAKQSTFTTNDLKLKIKKLKLNDEQVNQTSKLMGDFDEITISSKASFYTPTPGGIGPLTVAFLLTNLVKA